MKKTLLFTLAALLCVSAFGQKISPAPSKGTFGDLSINADFANARTTSTVIHDSIPMEWDSLSIDTETNYYISQTGASIDSGYLGGVSYLGYTGFAQRYDFTAADSTVSVLGAIAIFSGNIHTTATTTQTVSIKLWSPAAPITVRPTLIFSGFPGSIIDSTLPISITKLGIGINDTAPDSIATFWFPTASAYLSTSFFIGYTTSYNFHALNGDTIALETTRLGERSGSPEYTVSGGDTTVNNAVAVLDTSAGSSYWYDMWATLGHKLNFYIFPIVDSKVIRAGVGIIKNNGLTFLGNYPNPAVDNTTIAFSLEDNTDVQITLTDMSGRTIKTLNQGNMSAGQHTVNLVTSDLAAGTYLYLLKTSSGGGVASKLTIVK